MNENSNSATLMKAEAFFASFFLHVIFFLLLNATWKYLPLSNDNRSLNVLWFSALSLSDGVLGGGSGAETLDSPLAEDIQDTHEPSFAAGHITDGAALDEDETGEQPLLLQTLKSPPSTTSAANKKQADLSTGRKPNVNLTAAYEAAMTPKIKQPKQSGAFNQLPAQRLFDQSTAENPKTHEPITERSQSQQRPEEKGRVRLDQPANSENALSPSAQPYTPSMPLATQPLKPLPLNGPVIAQTSIDAEIALKRSQTERKVSAPLAQNQKKESEVPERIVSPPREKPETVVKNPSPPNGIVIPAAYGDLKVIVTGGEGVTITILFRDYPKSSRTRVSSRRGNRTLLKLLPKNFRTLEGNETIIESAKEGVYIVVAESTNGNTAHATIALKLFELSARRRIRSLGTRAISEKQVITKILMPEGVIWDDESAFTGSMDDSNSTTKYNAETGIVWKEYTE